MMKIRVHLYKCTKCGYEWLTEERYDCPECGGLMVSDEGEDND